jgi:uncharacterized protein (TIGR00730 family)
MRIALYCGSNSGVNPAFTAAAAGLASHLARAGIGIVYGGGRVGLMGAVAAAALAAGGEVIGVIPQALMDKELGHTGVSRLHVVGSMHERKQLMVDLSDAFIALPGGYGTLDELFETLTWLQLGFHGKPVGLLNVGGFFDGLLGFLDRVRDDGFLLGGHRDCLLVDTCHEALLARLQAFRAPDFGKWIERLTGEVR